MTKENRDFTLQLIGIVVGSILFVFTQLNMISCQLEDSQIWKARAVEIEQEKTKQHQACCPLELGEEK